MSKSTLSNLNCLPKLLTRIKKTDFGKNVKMDKMNELTHGRMIEISGSAYYVKRLHQVPDLVDECCDFINTEWKRSHTARLRSIEGSSEKFPMSLVLLKKEGEKTVIVGHCRISRLSMSNTKVFVETVVIHPKLRGKGLGKFLMNEVEELCKSKSIKQIYLSTRGQEGFYEKLGYTKCPPVSLYGSQFNNLDEEVIKAEKEVKQLPNIVLNNKTNVPLPPPPPPLPKTSFKEQTITSSKTFMSKNLF